MLVIKDATAHSVRHSSPSYFVGLPALQRFTSTPYASACGHYAPGAGRGAPTCSFSLNVRPKVVSITFTHFLLVRIKLHVHGWLQRRLRNVVLSIQLKIRGLIHTEEGGTHVGGQVPITVTYPWPLSVLLPFTGNLGSVHYCTLRAKKIVTSTFMKCVVQT